MFSSFFLRAWVGCAPNEASVLRVRPATLDSGYRVSPLRCGASWKAARTVVTVAVQQHHLQIVYPVKKVAGRTCSISVLVALYINQVNSKSKIDRDSVVTRCFCHGSSW